MFTRFAKYTVLCFALIFITSSLLHAQNDQERDPGYIFYKANSLYEEGKYDEAINMYSGLIEKGLESGNLYYNIGNSYFKKGELGRAILNYERANKLIPGDSDLKSNYDFALSKVRNVISVTSIPFQKKVMALYKSFSINGLTILLSAIYIILLLVVFIFIIVRPGVRHKTIFAACLILFFLLTSYALFDRIRSDNRGAVLISADSDARFEPIEDATVHFTLYEGTKIYVIQQKRDWFKIRRQDGKVGWINKDDVEII